MVNWRGWRVVGEGGGVVSRSGRCVDTGGR